MDSAVASISLAGGLIVIAVVCGAMSAMIASGALTRNGLVGIRTRATRRSDAAWSAGHEAARPAVRVTTVVSAAAALATVLVGIGLSGSPSADDATLVVGLSGYAVVLAVLGYACVQADRAARVVAGLRG